MKLFSFYNLGNTCYINSVLQCFINDPYFQKKIKKQSGGIYDLLNEINVDLTENDTFKYDKYNLEQIVYFFRTKFKKFEQYDSHEFLLEFLETLKLNHYSGVIKSSVVCLNCNNVNCNLENFYTIDIPVLHSNLIENFMKYLKKENIHEYDCEKCKCKTECQKKLYLNKLPKTLIIVLKKYNGTESTFTDLKIKETLSENIYNYLLYAVIYHYGTLDNGHYNCSVKINENWYFIDDDKIYLNNNELNYKNSYILFYKRY